MIRGDDDIFSIMDEMSSGNAKDHISPAAENISPTPTNQRNHHRTRMLAELDGYGKEDKYCPENGLGGSIWNPYVSVDLKGLSSNANVPVSSFTPPTNPYVEVARRRAYEKFKTKFYTTFNWIATSQNQGQRSNQKLEKKQGFELNSLWNKLPSHSILERYHFACKVEETFQVMRKRKKDNAGGAIPSNADVGKIATLFAAGKESGVLIDPILLAPFQTNQSSSVLLKNEIQFQFMREFKKATKGKDVKEVHEFFASQGFQKRCTKIARGINDIGIECDREFMGDLRKKATEVAKSSSHSSRKRKGIPKLSFESKQEKDSKDVVESYSLTYSGLSFRVSKAHFEKMQLLFDRHNSQSRSIAEHQDSFYSALFALLTRYDLLEGAGLQSSLNGNVFDVLLKHFSCNTECFASPFNSRYERFCSAFPDTDCAFGSLGSFFNFDFEQLTNGGCFQANPPFASDFILQMCKRMEELLSKKSLPPLMFIVFVPAWQDSQGWQALSKASALSHHLLLSQKDDPHYYCEGTQHRRFKGRYRIATFDTSVFFMQNAAAKDKWPITQEMLQELREAFGSNPEESSTSLQTPKPASAVKVRQEKAGKEGQKAPKFDQSNDKIDRKRKQNENIGKRAKAKKKLVSDDGQSQLAILSSLGIMSAPSNQATDIKKQKGKQKSR